MQATHDQSEADDPAMAGTDSNFRGSFILEVGEDGVALATFQAQESRVNLLDPDTLSEIEGALDAVERDPNLRGLIFRSGKPGNFLAGADLRRMSAGWDVEKLESWIRQGQRIFSRIAGLPVPTVAAVDGACLGGGYELALACDFCIATDSPRTRLGLPETQLGLIPAWGGCTRLPRRVGWRRAIDLILEGRTLPAAQARRKGMVDDVVPPEQLLASARRALARGKPRRKSRHRTRGGTAALLLGHLARRKVREKTRGLYPAAEEALTIVNRTLFLPIEHSLRLEREAILRLASGPVCRNLISLFFLREKAKKPSAGSHHPDSSAAIRRAAVIGAGIMGAGIAQWFSSKGLQVLLRDVDDRQVGAGMQRIAELYRQGSRRRLFSASEARAGLDRIFPAPGNVPLRKVELVVEAIVENLEIKKSVFRELDAQIGPEVLLATNTSALPVSELAGATRHPERVLGLHFFNPVHRMALVEVVAARQTSPEALLRAGDFIRAIGKIPVEVKDRPGFLVNRVLMPYLVEAALLFEQGVPVASIDETALDFGMPMGPLRLLDEVGLDVAADVARTLQDGFPSRMRMPGVLHKMTAAGLLGRKNGRGFYVHGGRSGRKARPSPEALRLQYESDRPDLPPERLRERLLYPMLNEAALCLEEGIAGSPGDIDLAMVLGTGFAPWTGGPLRYTDSAGPGKVADALARLAEETGDPRFTPAESLRKDTLFFADRS